MSGHDPNHETPENIVVHGQDGHEFEVDELEDKELDRTAGGVGEMDQKSDNLTRTGSTSPTKKTIYVDKTVPDLGR